MFAFERRAASWRELSVWRTFLQFPRRRATLLGTRAITLPLGAGLGCGVGLVGLDRVYLQRSAAKSMTGFLAFAVLVLLACNDAWSAGLFDESVRARMLNQAMGASRTSRASTTTFTSTSTDRCFP
jgi:hypothetical protein